jgi:histidine phosphotransferase ChpT
VTAELELIALMASRICHDLISPVGAIANGIEILAEENGPDGDAQMRVQALDLIAQSAEQASRRLTYCRMAYGAAGGASAKIDLNEARKVASDFLAGGKVTLDWRLAPGAAPRNVAKLALILVALGADCLARGGVLTVDGRPQGSDFALSVRAGAERISLNPGLSAALAGSMTLDQVDAKLAPAVYAGGLARGVNGFVQLFEEAGAIRMDAIIC